MKYLIFVGFILCGFSHLAQTERLLSCSNFFGSISIQTNKGNYSIRFFNEKSVETSFNFTSFSDTTLSHAVIAKPQLYKLFVDRKGNHTQTVYLKENVLNGISIGVDSIPFNITYYYGSRRLFSQNIWPHW